MSAHRFFKNTNPRQKVYLSGLGAWVQFSPVNDDVGILATQNPQAISDLLDCQKAGTSGVREISPEEYAELDKKKVGLTNSPSGWREEFNPAKRRMRPTVTGHAAETRESPAELARAAVAEVEKLKARLEQSPLPEHLTPKPRSEQKE